MTSTRLNVRRSRNRRKTSSGGAAPNTARIDALTAAGRANWLALLAYLAFALVTTLGVEDVDFFVDSRQTRLPLVGVSIPTFSFFVFAPILGTALYAYLHLHIRKVTEALAEAAPGPPHLEEQIKPWLLNDFVLRQRRDGAIRPRALDWIASLATLGLIWLAGPLVLALMWWRTWPAHAFWLTSLCGVALVLSVYVGLRSWTKMRRDTGHGARFLPVLGLTICVAMVVLGRGYTATSGLVPPIVNPKLPIEIFQYGLVARADLRAAPIADLPLGTRDHVTAHLSYRQKWCALRGVSNAVCQTLSTPTALTPRFDVAAFRICAEKQDFATCFRASAPPESTLMKEWRAFRKAEIDSLAGPELARRDLSAANLKYAALVGVDIFSSDLRGANLVSTRMEQTDLRSSDLSRASLHLADLRGALLFWTTLDRAKFSGAQMQSAELSQAGGEKTNFGSAHLQDARLEDVVLHEASFSGASLEHAYLYGADLKGSHFPGASLAYVYAPRVKLIDAKLQSTDLTGANMSVARLDDAFLYRTRFVGTVLENASFSGARFDETQMRAVLGTSADFRGAVGLDQSHLDGVVGDARTLLPDAADADTGAQLYVHSCLPRGSDAWEHLTPTIWRRARADPIEAAESLAAILCAPGEVPRKTGTPWPTDTPPPWEANPDWQPEDRGAIQEDNSVE